MSQLRVYSRRKTSFVIMTFKTLTFLRTVVTIWFRERTLVQVGTTHFCHAGHETHCIRLMYTENQGRQMPKSLLTNKPGRKLAVPSPRDSKIILDIKANELSYVFFSACQHQLLRRKISIYLQCTFILNTEGLLT